MNRQDVSVSNGKISLEPSCIHVEKAHRNLKIIQERYALEMDQLVVGKSLLTLRSLEILAGSVEQLHDQFYLSLRAVAAIEGPSE